MQNEDLNKKFEEINKKLDYLIEEIELQKKHRREIDDLKEDLMRVGREVFDTAVVELEEVHDHIQTGDIYYLFKKLLRNVNNITKIFEQIENIRDFIQDFGPVSKELFKDFMNKMDEFDRKGYFEFYREFKDITDKIITSFPVNELRSLGNNIEQIIFTVKNIAQPEVLTAINNFISAYKDINFEIKDKITLRKLIKEFNQPEVKKGLYITLQVLKNISNIKNNNLLK